jgi:MYXO-CTERM domain-containing protein
MRALAVALFLLVAASASADIPPPNACQRAGDACDTAGPDYKSKGVCQKQTCSRTLPGPNGPETRSYDCNLCVLAEAPKEAPPAAKKASACSVGHAGGGAGGALALLAGLLVLRRRR